MELTMTEFIVGVLSTNLVRYFSVAGFFFLIFYVLFKKNWVPKKIQNRLPKSQDYYREIEYSLISLFIFMLVALLAIRSPLGEYDLRYQSIETHGIGYWFLSVFLMILMHDTYFYWTHRAMHHPKIYRLFHEVHHKSTNPSPWAAFAFHPLEGVVEAGIIFPIIYLIPYHTSALFVFLVFMTFYNVYGHLGYELYPKRFNKSFIGKWLNTSVSHNAHHSKFNGNYGLYFLFWDRWMGTLREDYDTNFAEVDQIRRDAEIIRKNNG
jgi:sterol desaturase/sphingolipid hydroxylase (fatty acid hydroxylase superfamily)